MKRISLVLLSLSVLFFSSFCRSDVFSNKTVDIDAVILALNAGNAAQLSKFFDNRIDIGLPDKSDNYSRTQAEMIIREFFSNNGVRNFEIKHKSEKAGSNYCVGTLKTKSGDFRTTVFMKQKGDKQYLQDISFQRAD